MPTNRDEGPGGANARLGTPRPSPERIIAEQERKYRGVSDGELVSIARDLCDEAATLLNAANQNPREALNRAYRKTSEAREAMEVIARRWMAPTERNREES